MVTIIVVAWLTAGVNLPKNNIIINESDLCGRKELKW